LPFGKEYMFGEYPHYVGPSGNPAIRLALRKRLSVTH
jgi:hypothetical protein